MIVFVLLLASCQAAKFKAGESDLESRVGYNGHSSNYANYGIYKGGQDDYIARYLGDPTVTGVNWEEILSHSLDTHGVQGSALETRVGERQCTECSCTGWDGSNYSNCREVTDENRCNGYCVKCESDGQTPMPGGWTEHTDKCADYETEFQAITVDTCEDFDGLSSLQSDNECKRALEFFGKSDTWEKQTSSTSRYNGCFTASGSGNSYYVYDKRSSKYAMSDPNSRVSAGSKPRKTAAVDYTYYCYSEWEREAEVGNWGEKVWKDTMNGLSSTNGGDTLSTSFSVVPSSSDFSLDTACVYGFAVIGLGAIIYGAKQHFFPAEKFSYATVEV